MGPEGMIVEDLAKVLAVNPSEVVKKLFLKGVLAHVNQQLDVETVRIAAAAFGAEAIEADIEVCLCPTCLWCMLLLHFVPYVLWICIDVDRWIVAEVRGIAGSDLI